MKKKVYKAFNEQVQAELYSAYMYLAMSLDMEAKNFKGMAHWLKAQYEEEREHAFKLMGFMQDCGEKPELLAIEAPAADYGTPLELFKKVLEHEKYVTSLINTIYAAAYEDQDFRTMQMLDWFVKEQGEEEKTASDMITKMELFGDDAKGLYMLNSEMLGRTYSAPSLTL